MFPLPWIEIQCESGSTSSSPPGTFWSIVDAIRQVLPWREAKTVVTQSGYQAALGTCSSTAAGEEAARVERELAEAMSPSPLMAIWPALVLAGALAGFLLPNGRCRLAVMGICAAAALQLLLLQNAMGFPLPVAIEKDAASRGRSNPFDQGLYATLSPWFGLAVLGTGGALVFVGLEWRQERRKARVPVPEPCEPDPPPGSQ
jgi:hypothetical protein